MRGWKRFYRKLQFAFQTRKQSIRIKLRGLHSIISYRLRWFFSITHLVSTKNCQQILQPPDKKSCSLNLTRKNSELPSKSFQTKQRKQIKMQSSKPDKQLKPTIRSLPSKLNMKKERKNSNLR